MAKKTLPASDGSSTTSTPATPARKRTTTRRTTSAVGAATGELAMAGAAMDTAAEMNAILAATDRRYDPAFHEIAEAAYLRYLQRGGQDGRDFDDWIEAERELKRRSAS